MLPEPDIVRRDRDSPFVIQARLNGDLQPPKVMVRDIYPNAYDASNIQGLGGLILAGIESSKAA